MAVSCQSFFKFLLCTINFVFLVGGALMLALGIALVAAPDKVLTFVSNNGLDYSTFSNAAGSFFNNIIQACAIFMIVLGAVVAIIAFMGFCGACVNDGTCLLTTYAIILSIIVLCEVALIVFAYFYPEVFKNTGENALRETLTNGFKSDIQLVDGSFSNSSLQPVDTAWTALQFQLGCCGALNATDYTGFKWKPFSCTGTPSPFWCAPSGNNFVVPISCCNVTGDPHIPTSMNEFLDVSTCLTSGNSYATNTIGCFTKMENEVTDFIRNYSAIAYGIAAGIAGVELILICMSCYVCCKRREKD